MSMTPALTGNFDALIPEQTGRSSVILSRPYAALYIALLDEAVANLAGICAGSHDAAIATEVELCRRWVGGEDQGGITFENVCDGLGLDPSAVRMWLLANAGHRRRKRQGNA